MCVPLGPRRMAPDAIFQYAGRVHITVKLQRHNHSGAHFGPLRAIEAEILLSILHMQPIRLSPSRETDAACDSISRIVRQ
jgi:hypothetical protein